MTPLPWWGDLIVGTAAVLLALGTIWRYVVPALKAIGRGVRATWRAGRFLIDLVEDFRETGGFAGLSAQNTALTEKVEGITRELHPNGGSSMRDSLTRTEKALHALGDRLTEVDQKATDLGERQEALRQADEATAADLKRFLEHEYRDTQEANAHLRASVNELLAIREDGNDEDRV